MDQSPQLSNREREVVQLLLKGKSNKLIAAALSVSERTVEFHLKNIYAKYQVSSRMELVLKLEYHRSETALERNIRACAKSFRIKRCSRRRLRRRLLWETSAARFAGRWEHG